MGGPSRLSGAGCVEEGVLRVLVAPKGQGALSGWRDADGDDIGGSLEESTGMRSD